jgi:hypothetical protein
MFGMDQLTQEIKKDIACAGPIAGKPAPTGFAPA